MVRTLQSLLILAIEGLQKWLSHVQEALHRSAKKQFGPVKAYPANLNLPPRLCTPLVPTEGVEGEYLPTEGFPHDRSKWSPDGTWQGGISQDQEAAELERALVALQDAQAIEDKYFPGRRASIYETDINAVEMAKRLGKDVIHVPVSKSVTEAAKANLASARQTVEDDEEPMTAAEGLAKYPPVKGEVV